MTSTIAATPITATPTRTRTLAFLLLLGLLLGLSATGCGSSSGSPGDGGGEDAPAPVEIDYVAENRTITSSAVERSYVLSVPATPGASAMPVVFALHGDGGNGTNFRSSLGLEAYADTGAVFVYPNVSGSNTFEYYSYDGRTREAQFVEDVLAELTTEEDYGIDTERVFITGFSGGATMANALGCRLGPNVIRGLGIHSGSLYATMNGDGDPDFTYTGNGGVSCPLPATLFVWGEGDDANGVSFATGEGVRDNYLATQGCDATTTEAPVASCNTYDGCERAVVWCPIGGMGHSLWPGAARALWAFFHALN